MPNPSEFEHRYPFSYWQTELQNFQTADAKTGPSDESLALALSEIDEGTQEQALDLSLSSKSKFLDSYGSMCETMPQSEFVFENNLADVAASLEVNQNSREIPGTSFRSRKRTSWSESPEFSGRDKPQVLKKI